MPVDERDMGLQDIDGYCRVSEKPVLLLACYLQYKRNYRSGESGESLKTREVEKWNGSETKYKKGTSRKNKQRGGEACEISIGGGRFGMQWLALLRAVA